MIILLIVVYGFRIWELDEHSFFELVSAGLGEFVCCWNLTPSSCWISFVFCEDVEVSICIMVWRSLGIMR
jgi:hypothetical protein